MSKGASTRASPCEGDQGFPHEIKRPIWAAGHPVPSAQAGLFLRFPFSSASNINSQALYTGWRESVQASRGYGPCLSSRVAGIRLVEATERLMERR